MRVLVDIEERDGGSFVVVTAQGYAVPGGMLPLRPVRWAGDGRLLVAAGEDVSDADATALADGIEKGTATAVDLARYGRLLFEATFGDESWRGLVTLAVDHAAMAGGAPLGRCLEIAIRGRADGDYGEAAGALHGLRWEALHDGEAHVAARGTRPGDGSAGQRVPVGVVRLVPSDGADDVGGFTRIEWMPRVLFAIGSRLTDPQVRPGAEFMGIMRHLDRNGGAIYPRVLESASRASLKKAVADFKPDIVHLIGHGRWIPQEECVKLQFQGDGPGPGEDYISADQLLSVFEAARRVPVMVVLSACRTASASGTTDPSDGRVNGLSFAARLVAGGVPVVVAMAGDIADTACRVFTRALTLAIEGGLPLGEAVIRGRRAAFLEGDSIDSTDWVLPAIFTCERIDGGEILVNHKAIETVQRRIQYLDLTDEPVFFGRGDFIDLMDRILDAKDPLNVLVAYTRDPGKRYGGWRLLRELAARAVRAGCLPVLLGPYDQEPLASRAELARQLKKKMRHIRKGHGLSPVEYRTVSVAADPAADADDLADAIRADFEQILADLPDSDPVRAREDPDPKAGVLAPRIVLFCHRVDQWGDVLDDLIEVLGSVGLGSGVGPVPVVLTGVVGADRSGFHDAVEGQWRGPGWVKCLPLEWFRSDEKNPEDTLAYQTWLLNPPDKLDVKYPVFAPKRGAPTDWQVTMRTVLAAMGVLYNPVIFGIAASMPASFTFDRDDDLLAGYEEAAGDD